MAIEHNRKFSPQHAERRADVLPVLDEALARLPRRQRDALVLRYFEGMKEAEIASVMGCPRGTISSWIVRGLGSLRKRLLRRGIVVSSAALAGVMVNSVAEASAVTSGTALAAAIHTQAPGVLSIAEGVAKTMFWAKVKIAATSAALACAVGVSGVGTWKALSVEARPDAKEAVNYALAASGATVSGGIARNKDCIPAMLADGVTTGYTGVTGYAYARVGDPLLVTLAEPKMIERTRTLFWNLDERYHRYAIETSLDGATWQTAVDKTGHGQWSGWQVDVFRPRMARYIRLTCTYNSHPTYGPHYAVIELEAYGEDS